MSVEYDIYLDDHIRNVAKGLDWLRTNLPNILKESENLTVNYDLQFSEHDKSKWDREEYIAYDNYFYGHNKSAKVVQEFNKAWLRHIHLNPHHWQHWVLIHDEEDEGETCIEMPYKYVVEMICDWWAFSWAKGDLTEIFDWWGKHSDYIKFHPKTRRLVVDILGRLRERLGILDNELTHHGIKGQKWGVRRTPEELAAARGVASDEKSGIMEKDFEIPKSLSAKGKNYRVYDPSSGESFYFAEGTKIKNPTVFAGKGGTKPLSPEVSEGLSETYGGEPNNWQHCKGIGTLDFHSEDRLAEVHWFQEHSAGKHKFRVKRWLD